MEEYTDMRSRSELSQHLARLQQESARHADTVKLQKSPSKLKTASKTRVSIRAPSTMSASELNNSIMKKKFTENGAQTDVQYQTNQLPDGRKITRASFVNSPAVSSQRVGSVLK